ncbi:MAG: endopeptidase La, partial [Candidatus Magasanikbacteria bacterium]|nr:endopeptidase La [Candidatus Magasanikbacteria bacterium]
NTSSISSEYGVSLKFLNWLARIPWNIKSTENSDIKNAAKILNDSHFGMEYVKDRIIEHLAVNYLNPNQKGKILCLVGPPGTGKTSISKAIANAMGRKFARFSVGGMRDEAEIKGHRRTYVGALPGKFTSLLAECGTRNPVITIDEIDKMTSNSQGNPSAALLELLDPEQNIHFIDHYFGEIPIDASDVFFITTANDLSTIEPPLRDRLEIIEIHSYTVLEKREIAKSFLIPKQLQSNGISDWEISFSDESIFHLINGYTREAGVRNLEREIGNVCRKTATKIVMDMPYDKIVDNQTIESLIDSPTYQNRNNFELEIGEVKGLAWTSVGGKVLKAQVIKTMNTSTIEKTGSLGDIMKESITTALNLAINIEDKDKADKELTLKKCGLQIHFPAGATPKDGPSAGITIFTALVSALSGTKVNPYIAMTGEIDTMGNVLPVGGLTEKIIAAHREGVTKVIISLMNQGDKDLVNLPKEVTDSVEIIYVKKVNEVLEHALIKE